MKTNELKQALKAAVTAAEASGKLMRLHRRRTKKVNEALHHDIKLELDVRSQKLITRTLAKAFPKIPVLGEEGIDAKVEAAPARWVVDPIDGTVNYAYGIPHACVSIALQIRQPDGTFRTDVGVVYDPFVNDLWTAIRGTRTKLNGAPIAVSKRKKLEEAIVSLGFAKNDESLDATIAHFAALTRRVRKLRIMGSAALAFAYVADGRFDAYLERGVRLWDVAAGALLVECAGGIHGCEDLPGEHRVRVTCHNGRLASSLAQLR